MIKRTAALLMIALTIGSVGLFATTTAFTSNQTTSEHSTRDIGAVWDGFVKITPASFRPNVSDEAAIAMAAQSVKINTHWDVLGLKLPARVTVGTFTGKPEGSRPYVMDAPVRIVVFDDLPVRARIGETVKSRISVVLDDLNGEFLYSVISMDTRGVVMPPLPTISPEAK